MMSFIQLAFEKRPYSWWTSQTNFGPSYFVRALIDEAGCFLERDSVKLKDSYSGEVKKTLNTFKNEVGTGY
jgi:hypothetical protein